MKKVIFGTLVLAVMLLAGCTTVTTPYGVTENPVGDKVGEGLSLQEAAANGGVQKIATVDQRVKYFGGYGNILISRTYIVTGE
jgi:uncharacterized protein YceK